MGANIFMIGLFFMWGFLTCLNDILLPHLKALFNLDYTQAALIQFSFFSAYFLFAIPFGRLLARVGYKSAIAFGLLLGAIGAWLFYPASEFRIYALFLLALFVLASGITLLQVAANPLVTLLGDEATAVRRLNLTQAFNSLGTTVAPWFGSVFILTGAASLTSSSGEASVAGSYIGIGSLLFIIFLVALFMKFPALKVRRQKSTFALGSALRVPRLALGTLAIFLYVGAEVSIGSYLVNFFSQSNIANLTEDRAARFVSFYWGGAMVGRFIGFNLMQRIKPENLLCVFAFVNVLLLILTISGTGSLAFWSVLAIGLFNSIMFPTIFALAIDGLKGLTEEGSSLLVMAIVGGAILPLLQGILADQIGLQTAFIMPLLCYLYIAYYGRWTAKNPVQR